MKSQAHTITREIVSGYYEVKHRPADRTWYSHFLLTKSNKRWLITYDGNHAWIDGKMVDAVAFITTVTETSDWCLFQK